LLKLKGKQIRLLKGFYVATLRGLKPKALTGSGLRPLFLFRHRA
jgi:hypothetical protein